MSWHEGVNVFSTIFILNINFHTPQPLQYDKKNMDSHFDPQLEASRLIELQRENNQIISKLKADIDLLKWKLKQFGSEAYQETDYNSLLRQEGQDVVQALKDKLQKEIEQCAIQLKETVTLTGFTVDSFDRRVEVLDDAHCVKEFKMDGTVLNRRFCLSCTLEQEYSTEAESPIGGKITWFEIQFQEDIHKAIGQYVLKAAEKIALHSAFSLLKSYLQWKKERDDAVVQLSNLYPGKLSLFTSEDGIHTLKITNPKANRQIFTVEWGRKTVDCESRIVPDIRLMVDAPDKWTAMDSKNVLGSAPEIFELMVTTLGVEKALKAFVELVVTDGKLLQTSLLDDNHQRDAVS